MADIETAELFHFSGKEDDLKGKMNWNFGSEQIDFIHNLRSRVVRQAYYKWNQEYAIRSKLVVAN